jgi:hypothetical protein
MEKTAGDALRAMGNQGGYIALPPAIRYNPTKHVSLMPGVGGEYAPKVPYWYFDGKTQIPSIRYMEYEVQRYVDDNLAGCLDNYTSMRDEYIINELSNFSSSVVFTERETIVGLDYVVDIQPRGKEETTRQEQFTVKLDVPIKTMHELAKEILEAENRMTFFENLTLNLMASHPKEDIPFTGMEFHCGRLQWSLSEIKRKTIKALEPAIFAVRFKGTDTGDFPKEKEDAYRAVDAAVQEWRSSTVKRPLVLPKNIPEDSFEYFQYYFQFTDEQYKYKPYKVVAKFSKDWQMNLLATPNEHGILKSGVQDLKSQIMSFLCLNTFHFVYDLNYPVTISINAPQAFHGQGYIFRYAFPVQMYHNKPDRSLLPTAIIEPTEYSLDYCDYQSPQEHTIIARDAVTNAELSKVNLTFRCLTEQCILGVTRTNNRHLQWAGKFPDGCSGALIVANRSGYVETQKQHDGAEPFIIDMYPTQKVVFDVKRHTENAPGVARFLEPDMYAILQLELIEPKIGAEISIFEAFGSKDILNRTEQFELLRGDAVYDLNIMLMKKMSKDEDMMVGGWVGNWTVRLSDMLDAKKVVFHVPQKYPTPKTESDIIAVYALMTNRILCPDCVPEIIRADEYRGETPDVT